MGYVVPPKLRELKRENWGRILIEGSPRSLVELVRILAGMQNQSYNNNDSNNDNDNNNHNYNNKQ